MYQIKQSESTAARRRIPVLFVSSTDGFTPTTPTSPVAYISTNGGTFVATTNAVTLETLAAGQSACGCYYLELTATEVATLGVINVNVQSTNCRQYNAVIQVMAYDYAAGTNLGLSYLDAQVSTRLATSGYSAAPSVAAIWSEVLSSYNTNNTAGKMLKDLSNQTPAITGSTTNNITATTTTFSVDRNDADNTFNHQTIVFTSGLLNGVSSDIMTWTKSGSYAIVTVGDALPSAPNNNTSFYILPYHVQAITDIADGILKRKLDSTGDGTDTTDERTVRSALRAMRNKVSVANGTMTVYKEDDATTSWTGTVSNTADVTVNPTGGS
jgi:hypothetical protein